MKKRMVVCGLLAGLVLSACANPKKDDEEKKNGCGCQSSENVLDLKGTTENSVDSVTNPTARL